MFETDKQTDSKIIFYEIKWEKLNKPTSEVAVTSLPVLPHSPPKISAFLATTYNVESLNIMYICLVCLGMWLVTKLGVIYYVLLVNVLVSWIQNIHFKRTTTCNLVD